MLGLGQIFIAATARHNTIANDRLIEFANNAAYWDALIRKQAVAIRKYKPRPISKSSFKDQEKYLPSPSVCPKCQRSGYDLRSIERSNADEYGFFDKIFASKGEVVNNDLQINKIVNTIQVDEMICEVGKAIGMDTAFELYRKRQQQPKPKREKNNEHHR